MNFTKTADEFRKFHRIVQVMAQPLDISMANGDEWTNAWTFHVVLFSIFYSFLSIYAIYGVVRSYNRKEKVTRILAYITHSLIFVLGISRVFTLSVFYEVVDASVASRTTMISRLVFGLGFPCITAAFALVQFSFSAAMTGKISESKLGNFKFMTLIISGHFLVVIIVEIITAIVDKMPFLFFATKLYFLFMTAFSMIRMLHSGYQVLNHASENQRALHNFSVHYGATKTKVEITRTQSTQENDLKKSLNKVKIILLLTSIFCSIICIMEVYSIFELADILAGKEGALAPWPWYAYQTVFRLAELGMAGTILYTLAPAVKLKHLAEKCLLMWRSVFKKEKSASKNDQTNDDHPRAILNRAYNLENEN